MVMLLEQHLIEYCSPTLASLKTASLFNHTYTAEQELDAQLRLWNSRLNKKGIFLMDLYRRNNRALIYVYRRTHLICDLNREGAPGFLKQYGYLDTEVKNVDYALTRLRERVRRSDGFPHEIGVFLGYPLGDVIGFIENKGKNCKCRGYWKVYCDECHALRAFSKYKKCKWVYARLWRRGRSVWQLTVAA